MTPRHGPSTFLFNLDCGPSTCTYQLNGSRSSLTASPFMSTLNTASVIFWPCFYWSIPWDPDGRSINEIPQQPSERKPIRPHHVVQRQKKGKIERREEVVPERYRLRVVPPQVVATMTARPKTFLSLQPLKSKLCVWLRGGNCCPNLNSVRNGSRAAAATAPATAGVAVA